MKFKRAKTQDYDVYLSGDFKLEHRIAGFGIEVVDVYREGKFSHREVGHDALTQAQQWVAKQGEAA